MSLRAPRVMAGKHLVPGNRSGVTYFHRLALPILVAFFTASQAAAQVADAWLRYTPLEAYSGSMSTRLLAMGGIEVATWDDQSRIDPYHFGSNPAALLMARDSSLVEISAGYQDFEDHYYDQSHSAVQRGTGLHSEFRPDAPWAIDLDFNYGAMEASRRDPCPSPDDCRFIRDFDLQVSPQMEPAVEGQTVGAGVQTPLARITYARRFFRDLTIGARVGVRKEQEDRRTIELYDLDVTSKASDIAGGVFYSLPLFDRMFSLSGWGQYVSHSVVARSETPLNHDEYDWDRPQVGFGGGIYAKKGTWLVGIVDIRHRSYDGEEIARVNWAPQFYMNPFPSVTDPLNVFKREWLAFVSGYRHNEGSTRWLVGLPRTPVQFGMRYAYFKEHQWIRPNDLVIPTVNALDARRQGYRAAGGISLHLPDGGGVVATEARIAREFREDLTYTIPDISRITYSYHFGAEYRVHPRVPVRLGMELFRHDPNRSDSYAPFKGAGLTAGIGYFWNFIDSQIDLSYAHYHFHHAPSDPSEEIGFGDHVTLYIQRLF